MSAIYDKQANNRVIVSKKATINKNTLDFFSCIMYNYKMKFATLLTANFGNRLARLELKEKHTMKISKRAASVPSSLTLEITAQAKKLKDEGVDVVSFGAGEPDFNTPEYIRESAKSAIDKGLTKYTPASGLLSLKKVIADKLKRDNGLDYTPANIVVSNGAKHSLYNALMAVVEEGDEVIVPSPYWLTYPELIRFCGATPVFVQTKEENGFKITPEELKSAITPATKAFIFNNPNNPTGAVYTEEETKALAEVLEKTDVCIIADEIYEKLNYVCQPYSIACYSEKIKQNTILLNGVSKTYAMTGWRIGFLAAPDDVAKAISNVQSQMTSNPNSIAQYASITAYEGEEGEVFLDTMRVSFDRRRKLICSKLDEVEGVTYIKPHGAFYVMVNVGKAFGKRSGDAVIDSALSFANAFIRSHAVAVIPCEPFGAPEYVRLSYAISECDIVKGIDRLKDFIASLK